MRGTDRRRLQRAVRQVRDRFARVAANDFFGAGGREETHAALSELERVVAEPATGLRERPDPGGVLQPKDFRGRTWLTRPRPGIDRSASAWLIRRFVDPAARFAFGDKPAPSSKAVPFDMYDVAFSHQGGCCTYETLLERFGIADQAAARLGHLVHDLDLKETRYNVAEAPGVGRLIDGLRQVFPLDKDLIEHGIVVFEALYRSFTSAPAPSGARGRMRRRPGPGTGRTKGR